MVIDAEVLGGAEFGEELVGEGGGEVLPERDEEFLEGGLSCFFDIAVGGAVETGAESDDDGGDTEDGSDSLFGQTVELGDGEIIRFESDGSNFGGESWNDYTSGAVAGGRFLHFLGDVVGISLGELCAIGFGTDDKAWYRI